MTTEDKIVFIRANGNSIKEISNIMFITYDQITAILRKAGMNRAYYNEMKAELKSISKEERAGVFKHLRK